MNKKEFAKKVASKTGSTIEAATMSIDAVFNTLKENLQQGEMTVIREFGSFSVVNHAERNGVNPSTREPMRIAARKAVKFVASKSIELTNSKI